MPSQPRQGPCVVQRCGAVVSRRCLEGSRRPPTNYFARNIVTHVYAAKNKASDPLGRYGARNTVIIRSVSNPFYSEPPSPARLPLLPRRPT